MHIYLKLSVMQYTYKVNWEGIHEQREKKLARQLRMTIGKTKEMFTTNKKYTHCKRLACRVALEYGLKDSSCCTEWIDVHYKCIRDEYGTITWIHMPL